jgi:Cu+-exporting ATPase
MRVEYDMRRTGVDDLAGVLKPFGYRIHPLAASDNPEEVLFGRLLKRFVFALFLAVNIMMLSAVHWASWMEVLPPVDLQTVAVIQLVMILPLIALGVWPLLQRAVRLMRLGRPSMDLLFILGFSAAFFLSVAAFVFPSPDAHFYFDTCAAFVAIALFGRLVEGKLRLRAARDLRGIMDLSATKVAVRREDTTIDYLPLERIEPGQIVEVDPGQYVPFDGRSETERAAVSEAMLTGEPTPVLKALGDPIWAGSKALSDPVALTVTRPFHEGRLQQIAKGIAQALTRSELRLRSADRLASWFVPMVLLVALLTFVLRLVFLGEGDWLAPRVWMPTVSVLLVACPCAFGIASASALAVAVSTLLGRGVLVKDGTALERFAAVDRLVFDKTGTLTTGLWRVEKIHWWQPEDKSLLAAVAGAEAGVEHPVAHALRSHLIHTLGLEPAKVEAVELLPGRGIRTRLGSSSLTVGSLDLFEQAPDGLDPPDHVTLVAFGLDGKAAGAFLLTDTIREEAAPVVGWFRQRGIDSTVLSGDRTEVVRSVARALGIEQSEGNLTPEEKRDRIRDMTGTGAQFAVPSSARCARPAFAGDGSNDAPAMAESEVAISLRHGTNLSIETAHLLPVTGGLEILPGVYRASQATVRTLRRNFAWAFGYNLLFVPLAALGYLHPVFAAGLMFLSSVTVLISSLGLRSGIARVLEGNSSLDSLR